ncbi:hypothetical protein AWC38_SpisGene17446 [Stylophora pistillata]|uniref:Uncharacterized protein n=1 Tax=Stylophora pistillata TaxID=50429 RepID=A0A2B4RN20_STYPI|nr:hypothetical protein AWC38_SpisGene17446 [Stylophora pistillata]
MLVNSVTVESKEDEVVLVWVTSDALKDESSEGIPVLSEYAESLESWKERCLQKISVIAVDPASVTAEKFSPKCLPLVEVSDLLSYLVLETSFYTKKQFKAFKSLEAFNQMVSGFVTSVVGKVIAGNRVPRRSRNSFTVPPAVESEEDDVVVVGEVRNKSNGGQEVKQETTDTKPIPANPAESNKYSSLTNENLVTTSTVSSAKSPVTKRQPVRRQNTPAATSSEERQKILQQLKELHELKKCEALNAEEFEEKKRILLNDFR